MKTTKQHFEIFKQECQYWIDVLKLDNWNISFRHAAENENNAETERDVEAYSAVVGLNPDIDIDDIDLNVDDFIKRLAKHEMLHILCGTLGEMSLSRDFTGTDCLRAEEELVIKLENITSNHDIPMGVSQWINHGKKYGYDKYLCEQKNIENTKKKESSTND